MCIHCMVVLSPAAKFSSPPENSFCMVIVFFFNFCVLRPDLVGGRLDIDP